MKNLFHLYKCSIDLFLSSVYCSLLSLHSSVSVCVSSVGKVPFVTSIDSGDEDSFKFSSAKSKLFLKFSVEFFKKYQDE